MDIFKKTLSAYAKLMYVYLSQRASANGEVVLSHNEIGQATSTSESTVKKYLKELASAKLIKIEIRLNPNNPKEKLPNKYTVLSMPIFVPSRMTDDPEVGSQKPISSNSLKPKCHKELEKEDTPLPICPIKEVLKQYGMHVEQKQINYWESLGDTACIIHAIRKALSRQRDSWRGYVTTILRNPYGMGMPQEPQNNLIFNHTHAKNPIFKKSHATQSGDPKVSAYIAKLKAAGL